MAIPDDVYFTQLLRQHSEAPEAISGELSLLKDLLEQRLKRLERAIDFAQAELDEPGAQEQALKASQERLETLKETLKRTRALHRFLSLQDTIEEAIPELDNDWVVPVRPSTPPRFIPARRRRRRSLRRPLERRSSDVWKLAF